MTYDEDLEDARRMDREHPDPDMSVSYEEAVKITRLEQETCRCSSPYQVNDLCEWHGGAIERAIANGKFWSMDWPWGEEARS